MSSFVKLGPWGGQGMVTWSFHFEEGARLKQIVVNSGIIVDAITFMVDDGSGISSQMKFGGNGGSPHTINLDPSKERVLEVSGAHGDFHKGHHLSSIAFRTNLKTYGPYGTVKVRAGVTNISSFSLPIQDGAVVGFHGRAHRYIDAIGVYVKPTGSTQL